MRTLTFVQITDSRFEPAETVLDTLNARIAAIKEKLNLPGIQLHVSSPWLVDWDDHIQYRTRFRVTKDRRITWNAIYELVNSVHAVPYKFES